MTGALVAWCAAAALAGPWTRDAGSFYAKAGADGYWAGSYQQPGVATRDEDRFLGQQYGAYAELGLSKGHPVQVAAGAPVSVGTLWFVRREGTGVAEGRATVHRLGDLRVRPQVALHPKAPVALAVEVKLPLYRVDSVCDEEPAFRAICPRPGDGQVDVMPLLLGGAPLGERGFVEAGAGWLHRTEAFVGEPTGLGFADSVVVNAGGGAWAGPVLAMLKLDANVSPVVDETTAQALRVGPAALVDVAEGVGIEARFQADVWARNAARGVGFGLGLSARR